MKEKITNKVLNSVKEYLNFTDNLLREGLVFEKKVTKFSNTSAAVYLPKRLIGRTFRIFLMPIADAYEVSEIGKESEIREAVVKPEVEKVKTEEDQPKRKNLLDVTK